jgi:hypothetical protein
MGHAQQMVLVCIVYVVSRDETDTLFLVAARQSLLTCLGFSS